MACASVAFANDAEDDVPEVFTGGVFDRKTVPASDLPPSPYPKNFELPNPAWKEPVLVDRDGNTNQLVIKLSDTSTVLRGLVSQNTPLPENASRYDLERAFVTAADNAAMRPTAESVALAENFQSPAAVRFLIGQFRPSDDARLFNSRIKTEGTDAYEDLHRYVVLLYPTVDVASAALKHRAWPKPSSN